MSGLTQIEFAQSLNSSQSTISKIESHSTEDISFELVSKIAKIFFIPIHHFEDGLLNIKIGPENQKNTSFFKKQYLKNGIFSSKTLFYSLFHLRNLNREFFEKTSPFDWSLLAFPSLKFNSTLILDLEKKFLQKFHDSILLALATILKEEEKIEEKIFNTSQLENYLKKIPFLEREGLLEKNKKNIYIFKLKDIGKHFNLFYDLICLDLKIHFNSKIKISQKDNDKIYLHFSSEKFVA